MNYGRFSGLGKGELKEVVKGMGLDLASFECLNTVSCVIRKSDRSQGVEWWEWVGFSAGFSQFYHCMVCSKS